MHYKSLIGKIIKGIGLDVGDEHVRDTLALSFHGDTGITEFTSLSERSSITAVEGNMDALIGAEVVSAVSTTHYDEGITYAAVCIQTADAKLVVTWAGNGYIPYDLDFLEGVPC